MNSPKQWGAYSAGREEGMGRKVERRGPQAQGQGPGPLGPDSSVIRSAETALNVLTSHL